MPPTYERSISSIESAPLNSSPVVGMLRHEERKDIAANIRKLFKRLGIVGVSVTVPRYSMAQSVDLSLPKSPDEIHPGHEHDWREHEFATCPACQRSQRAQQHLEEVILSYFPDLNDRSDSMTDYFDYRLSIHS